MTPLTLYFIASLMYCPRPLEASSMTIWNKALTRVFMIWRLVSWMWLELRFRMNCGTGTRPGILFIQFCLAYSWSVCPVSRYVWIGWSEPYHHRPSSHTYIPHVAVSSASVISFVRYVSWCPNSSFSSWPDLRNMLWELPLRTSTFLFSAPLLLYPRENRQQI